MDRLNKDPSILKFDDVSLESYPESLRCCTVCGGPYSTGQSIARTNCGFHSVHMHCEDRELEGQSPTCQNPNDVFPVADWEYLRRHRPEDVIITGFGRHRYDTDDYYILLTFDPEKREMYSFPLYSLRHKVSPATIQLKLMQFVATDLYKVPPHRLRGRWTC
jgi:hypothetical protein